MASPRMAPAAAPACPACRSSRTRPSRRRGLRDLARVWDGTTAWRCRSCRERFFLRPGGGVELECARPPQAAPFWQRLHWTRRLRRWWHNSYRWRLQHGRRLMRRTAMVVSLFALAALFLLVLAHYSGRAAE